MAPENEERELRRQRREELRRQRKKQDRKLIIALIAAALVLVACGVLIYVMTRSPGNSGPDTPATGDTGVVTAPTETGTQPDTKPESDMADRPDTTVITIAAAGDLNINDGVIASGGMTFQYTNAIMDVLPLLANADLTMLNFEGNLSGAPYGTETCSAPQSVADALKAAGVDIVQVANSRSIANGMIGLSATLQNLRLAGLEPVGAYATNAEAKQAGGYTICTVQGIRVAVVAFTKGMDSAALPSGSEKCVNVLYTDYASTYHKVDTSGITKILRAAEAEDPDITIALLHWGSEYNDAISDTQKDIRDLLFSEGVDAIIGSHPHYLQSMKFDQTNGRFIAYSLGDFFNDGQRSGTNYSVVLELEVTKDNRTGETKLTGYDYTPIYTVTGSDGLLRVVRLEAAMKAYENRYVDRVSEAVYEDMKYSLTRIEDRIHTEVKD